VTDTEPATRRRAQKAPAGGLGERLARLGIRRPCDALLHLPLRYEDETRLASIAAAARAQSPGGALVEGVVLSSEVRYRPRRTLVCTIADDSGTLAIRLLNFHAGQQRALAPGVRLRVFGDIRPGLLGAETVHPRWRAISDGTPLPQRLTPVYPTTQGVSQPQLQRLARQALAECDLDDSLPQPLLAALALEPFGASVRLLHEPPVGIALTTLADRTHPAWRRIKFDELLAQQLSMRAHRRRRFARRAQPLALALPEARDRGSAATPDPTVPAVPDLPTRLLAVAGFSLTGAQQRARAEIAADLARARPMQRLLQGDVGSGKTIVAALAAAQAVEAGAQVAVMAPTELLAEQTFRKFSGWFSALGVEVIWLAGSLTRKQRTLAAARLAGGEAQIAVGTHALFQQGVEFANLALAIVDEQHRFGVNQRLALRGKAAAPLPAGAGDRSALAAAGSPPAAAVPESARADRAETASTRADLEAHLLMMSATPIPRTLAMAAYADLDVSTIDELPPGRTPIATRLVADARRDEVIQRIRDACMQGRQAYWVCPLIEESEALQLQTAVDTHAALCATFPELAVGLVHGRLKAAEKAAAMAAFQRGEIKLLVATTVIEVGVDVPNASLMVIEHAERMGLAQLHQLRGRVGRGSAQSTCLLLYQSPLSPLARERLKVIYESNDGFEIARRDLELRGPGELMGARQSGLPMLRFADPVADVELLEQACEVAVTLLDTDPVAVERHLRRWLPDALSWLDG
jgi:ATP-dependent DNA helicase RecG